MVARARQRIARDAARLFWSQIDHLLVGDFVFGKASMRYASLDALLAATLIGFATSPPKVGSGDGAVTAASRSRLWAHRGGARLPRSTPGG